MSHQRMADATACSTWVYGGITADFEDPAGGGSTWVTSASARLVTNIEPLTVHDVAQAPLLLRKLQDSDLLLVMALESDDDVCNKGTEPSAAGAAVSTHNVNALAKLLGPHGSEVQLLVIEDPCLCLHQRVCGSYGNACTQVVDASIEILQ